MKYKVLLADDDMLMLQWIKNMHWETINCEITDTCLTGKEVLESMHRNHAEIVVTDIVMPECDGIELTKALHAVDESIQVILISSYCEFEYARNAMQEDIHDYLIKGLFEENDLFNAVHRAIERYDKLNIGRAKNCKECYPAALAMLSCYNKETKDEVLQSVKNRTFVIEEERYRMFLLQPNSSAEAFYNFLEEKLKAQNDTRPLCCVLNHPILSRLEIKDYAGIMNQTLFYSAKKICIAEEKEIAFPMNKTKEEKLWRKISGMSSQALFTYLKQNANTEFQTEKLNLIHVRRAIAKWILNFADRNSENIIVEAMESDTLKGLIEIIDKVVREKRELSDELEKMIFYINNHYQYPITIKELSKKIGYTPNYCGKLFAEKMGTHVSNYINQIRLEHAYCLLKSTSMSVQEIMKEVGFSDYTYFLSLYKKKFGETPSLTRRENEK